MNFVGSLIFSLLQWVVILGLIVYFVRRRKPALPPAQDREWYLRLALSNEDALSQLFLLLAGLFCGVTLAAFKRDFGWTLDGREILLITALVGLAGAYYFKAVYLLFFSLIGLTGWWGARAAGWLEKTDIRTAAIFAGLTFIALLFYSLGHLHEKEVRYKRFALVYLELGIVAIIGVLFCLSTKAGIAVLGEMSKGATCLASGPMTFSLFIILAALLGTTLYAAGQKLLFPFEALGVIALACLFGSALLLPQPTVLVQAAHNTAYGRLELTSAGLVWVVIYNIALFLKLLGSIFSGYLRRETWLVNLGALFLFVFIIVKYFDWFFSFLEKSVFFIIAGALLFGVGWSMEKGRRRMISQIKSQAEQL
jgi:hypothetical protein